MSVINTLLHIYCEDCDVKYEQLLANPDWAFKATSPPFCDVCGGSNTLIRAEAYCTATETTSSNDL